MAYTPLTAGDLIAGKPTKEEIFETIRLNQEGFNTDIEALKQTSTIQIFNTKFSGSITQYSLAQILNRTPTFRSPVDATIVSFKVVLLEVSTSGTLSIDIEKSTNEGVSWSTLLNNPVTLTGTTVGSLSGTVDWISVPLQSFLQDDLLRIIITTAQVDQGEFQVSIYGEVA